MKKKKTIGELLQMIPDEEIRPKALANAGRSFDIEPHMQTIASAIKSGFAWEDSPEGHDYWSGVVEHQAKEWDKDKLHTV